MAQVLVRNLDEAVVASLKARAMARGHSLEQELRSILAEAATPTPYDARASAEAIRSLSQSTVTVDLEALVREDRRR